MKVYHPYMQIMDTKGIQWYKSSCGCWRMRNDFTSYSADVTHILQCETFNFGEDFFKEVQKSNN